MANLNGSVGMFNLVNNNLSAVYSSVYNVNIIGPTDIN